MGCSLDTWGCRLEQKWGGGPQPCVALCGQVSLDCNDPEGAVFTCVATNRAPQQGTAAKGSDIGRSGGSSLGPPRRWLAGRPVAGPRPGSAELHGAAMQVRPEEAQG